MLLSVVLLLVVIDNMHSRTRSQMPDVPEKKVAADYHPDKDPSFDPPFQDSIDALLESSDFDNKEDKKEPKVRVDLTTEPGNRDLPAETPKQFEAFITEQRQKFGHLIKNHEQFELFAMLPIDDAGKFALIAKLQGEQDRQSSEPVILSLHYTDGPIGSKRLRA